MKRKRLDLVRLSAILVTIGGIAYFYLNIFSPQTIPKSLRIGAQRKPLNILILGTDTTYDRETRLPMPERQGRADTILVAHLDPIGSRVSVLSIPRDTFLEIPGYGMMKINVAHAYEGAQLVKRTVANFTGLRIDHYLKIKPSAVTRLVNQLGGLTLDVEEDMQYVDHAQGLVINLKKGKQKLSGKEAHDYIRYRDNFRGDIARIGRQQKFLKALFLALVNPANVFKAPFAIQACLQEIETDLALSQTLRILNWSRMLEIKNVSTVMAPGDVSFIRGAGSVWVVDKAALAAEIERLF
ncbi:LCP family protein [Candidatus Margulisiibacteriota bacterium]